MIKAVVFDLDDTLISEKEYIKSGYREIAKYLNQTYKIDNTNKIYDKLFELFKQDSKYVFNRILDCYNIEYNEEIIKKLIKIYREHVPDINFYDDVIPCLNKLKGNNIKLGIITDGYIETQRAKLNKLQAYELFDYIIITEELGRKFWKPNPKAFEIMKEKLNVGFDEMMYIGDNPKKDFYISKIYPIKTVRIVRKNSVYEDEEYLEDIREGCRIGSLNEIGVAFL